MIPFRNAQRAVIQRRSRGMITDELNSNSRARASEHASPRSSQFEWFSLPLYGRMGRNTVIVTRINRMAGRESYFKHRIERITG